MRRLVVILMLAVASGARAGEATSLFSMKSRNSGSCASASEGLCPKRGVPVGMRR